MTPAQSHLKNIKILAVDDEPDILDTIEEGSFWLQNSKNQL